MIEVESPEAWTGSKKGSLEASLASVLEIDIGLVPTLPTNEKSWWPTLQAWLSGFKLYLIHVGEVKYPTCLDIPADTLCLLRKPVIEHEPDMEQWAVGRINQKGLPELFFDPTGNEEYFKRYISYVYLFGSRIFIRK